jgi:hypothetical protein
VVMNRCMRKQHIRLFGEKQNWTQPGCLRGAPAPLSLFLPLRARRGRFKGRGLYHWHLTNAGVMMRYHGYRPHVHGRGPRRHRLALSRRG